MKAKKAIFWIILAIFVCLSAWWIFFLPYDRAALYSAVPLNAVFVSENERVAERWQSVATNPLTLCLLKNCGVDTNEIAKAVNDPLVAKAVNRFAARDTVIAYVPSLGDSGRPAWVLASWAGGQGQFLRFALEFGLIPKLEKVKLENGDHVWSIETKEGKPDSMLSVAVVQGVVLGCLSADKSGVQLIKERIQRGAPILPELNRRLDTTVAVSERSSALDRGWVDPSLLGGPHGAEKLQYELGTRGEQGLTGRIRGVFPLPAASPLRDNVDFKKLAGILGDSPDLFIAAPYSYVDAFLPTNNKATAWPIVGRFLKGAASERSSVFACMVGGAYSGRILGLKVPAVLAGMNVKKPDTVLDTVSESIDELNGQCKLGLVPNRALIGGHPAAVLGFNRNNLFASLAREERPALAMVTNWLVLSSSMGTMEKLLNGRQPASAFAQTLRRDESPTGPAGPRKTGGRWVRGVDTAGDATACAWIDFEAANGDLTHAIAVYKLSLIVQSGERSEVTLDRLNQISDWIDVLRPMKTCCLLLKSDASGFDLQFDFGAAP